MKLLITGGCGFLGSNLSAAALKQGFDLTLFDNLSRLGSADNLGWLRQQGHFQHVHGDIRNPNDVMRTIEDVRPDAVFHVAGQVAMTTSIANPRLDFETNAFGTLNLLEAVRAHAPEATIVYSSSNKVYGDLEWVDYQETDTRYVDPARPQGLGEDTPLDFQSPYGCSKGAADQYMQDFARVYGLRTVVFRHSSMYGLRQFGTFDQGWIAWFCAQAVKTKHGLLNAPFTIAGNGKQVRDVLEAKDMERLYFAAVRHIDKAAGQVFNVGGGMDNSLSLLELFGLLEECIGMPLAYEKLPARYSDQRIFVADLAKAKRLLDWQPQVGTREGIAAAVAWAEQTVSKI
ncbi:GDP-mannose 4,6-dehydratase [Sphingomonas qomolangmaensis]|uniref:GDP-mannose 4,6-dehydratase n=1 Tax=Sphingomonas qomolangmaensis TaxID=2918765 RepID=A0ABY5L5E6_9SPHN|nr:GDP-mannose 4,6-dehydratase [Sphingomonas qomolangmaensis]UUL82168.1 GDP-mannose 4,6-dehydratase [Sphingomonas qomolangmaensis]